MITIEFAKAYGKWCIYIQHRGFLRKCGTTTKWINPKKSDDYLWGTKEECEGVVKQFGAI